MTTPTINNGWLLAGSLRVKLATVERYEARGHKVVLSGVNWSHAIDCDPNPDFIAKLATEGKATRETMEAKAVQIVEATATAEAIVSLLDDYFAPAISTPSPLPK